MHSRKNVFVIFSSIFEVVHSRGAGTPTSSDVQFVCFDVLEFPKSTFSDYSVLSVDARRPHLAPARPRLWVSRTFDEWSG